MKNLCIYQDVRKVGAFHIEIQKYPVIHILFVERRGPVIYLVVLKKGVTWHAHLYYTILPYVLPHIGKTNTHSSPLLPTPLPQSQVQTSPFLMHANEYALSLLSLGNQTCLCLSMLWNHASCREFRMILGLCTMVFS